MRYPQGSLQLLAAAFAFQVDLLVADDIALIAPLRPATAAATKVEEMADAGILSHSTMVVGGIHHGKDDAATLTSVGNRAVEEDVGQFMSSSQQLTCTQGYVDCVDGFLKDDRSKSCKDACGGNCCVGGEIQSGYYFAACDYFTGKVCKDGSCNGCMTCRKSTLPLVVNSCKGYRTCAAAKARSVRNSCIMEEACYFLGMKEGEVGDVTNSCNGTYSCRHLGKSGKVGNVENSCNGKESCQNGGRGARVYLSGYYGSIYGGIEKSCNAERACYGAGQVICTEYSGDFECVKYEGGISSKLSSCCNSKSACEQIKESSLPTACLFPTTAKPTKTPTKKPTKKPTNMPTKEPTNMPTKKPAENPTKKPTSIPTKKPINMPTKKPTKKPNEKP